MLILILTFLSYTNSSRVFLLHLSFLAMLGILIFVSSLLFKFLQHFPLWVYIVLIRCHGKDLVDGGVFIQYIHWFSTSKEKSVRDSRKNM